MPKRKRGFIPFPETEDQRILDAWCSDNEGAPDDYHRGSGKKFKFICYVCNHPFSIALGHIAEGKWCGYCSGRKICGEPDCNNCYKKSFAYHNPEKALQWSPRNTILPIQVMRLSAQKFWFICSICGHEHYTRIGLAAIAGTCRFCDNKALCDTPDCPICHDKTFEFLSPIRSKEWSDKNELTPDRVYNSSNHMFVFNC